MPSVLIPKALQPAGFQVACLKSLKASSTQPNAHLTPDLCKAVQQWGSRVVFVFFPQSGCSTAVLFEQGWKLLPSSNSNAPHSTARPLFQQYADALASRADQKQTLFRMSFCRLLLFLSQRPVGDTDYGWMGSQWQSFPPIQPAPHGPLLSAMELSVCTYSITAEFSSPALTVTLNTLDRGHFWDFLVDDSWF